MCMRPANESRRYNVTSSLIGWAHTQNDIWTERFISQEASNAGNVSVTWRHHVQDLCVEDPYMRVEIINTLLILSKP